jgi:ATP-dependent protease ClpP protease subunit
MDGKREWFSFENRSGELRVDIFDEIGFFGVTAADFTRELQAVQADSIALHLNSPGGDVFDGIAIYNALKAHPANVNITVDGIAASIASVIAMAGDTVTMSKGSMMMIHEPFALVIGDSRDFRKQADALDLMGDSIAGIYAERAGKKPEEWRAFMVEEKWFGDQDAVDYGLADSVGRQVAVKNVFDLSIFRNYRASTHASEEVTPEQAPLPPKPDWAQNARLVAAAQLEVIHAYAR